MSNLLCSCLSCRRNPTNIQNCKFENKRGFEKRKIRLPDKEEKENEDDITNLTVKELKNICQLHRLAFSSRKDQLVSIIIPHIKGLSAIINQEYQLELMDNDDESGLEN